MQTKTAVENAIFPYLFGVICLEIVDHEDIDPRLDGLYKEFESYLLAWRDELPKTATTTFSRFLKRVEKELIWLCHDKQACDGAGGNSTTKTMGVFKGIMENVPIVKIEGFDKFEAACAKLDAIIYEHLGDEYDGQFDSGKIEKKVAKGIKLLKEMGYYGDV